MIYDLELMLIYLFACTFIVHDVRACNDRAPIIDEYT